MIGPNNGGFPFQPYTGNIDEFRCAGVECFGDR